MRPDIERDPAIRYGWYLRPSFAMSRAQAEIHDLVRRQFGYNGGGVFMPHATIKGFFRSDASVADLIAAFDTAVEGRQPFPVYNAGPTRYGRGSAVLDVNAMPDGRVNEPLRAIHVAGWDAIEPLIHPECAFSAIEPKYDNFFAHLTLTMADVPDEMGDEVWAFLRQAGQIGPQVFTADYVHLYAFESAGWSARWWETLEWKLLHSWALTSG